ncbi:hypothetical protein [Parvibaculum sp.]|uniref:hypothetical protein n=1 Tax=Parvibaculum sp. TaxID=2024848 RepID=UPI003918D943
MKFRRRSCRLRAAAPSLVAWNNAFSAFPAPCLPAFRPAQGFGGLLVAAIFMGGHGIGHLADIAGGCAARPGGTPLD